MTGLLLTVDLGNTSCKLRLWESSGERRPASISSAKFDSRAVASRELAEWIRGQRVPDSIALSCVASEELERAWPAMLRSYWPEASIVRPNPELEIRCREPERVGTDRLFAARGALECAGGSALVLDAGTALTVDAVEWDARAKRAAFLGGAIAPGPALLAEVLGRRGARLTAVDPKPGVAALGLDTKEALLAGVSVGFHGAAGELLRRIGQEAGLAHAPVVLTGGARAFLLEPPLAPERALLEVEGLVDIGLFAAASRKRPGGDLALESWPWRIR